MSALSSEKVRQDSFSAHDPPKTNVEKVGQDSFSTYDPPSTNVEFEDYLYFAAIQRREEDLATMPASEIERLKRITGSISCLNIKAQT
jgi:hypothetical protein